ncbi:MAG: LysM peptidoglycan-binding domain-containing protein [Pseudomonadota bacterium]
MGAFALLAAMVPVERAQAQGCGVQIEVLPGDTLARIAAECGVGIGALLDINPQIRDPRVIFPGEVIAVPQGRGLRLIYREDVFFDEGFSEFDDVRERDLSRAERREFRRAIRRAYKEGLRDGRRDVRRYRRDDDDDDDDDDD